MERPFPAYRGDDPYIFVSYAHKDSVIAYPEIRWLQDQGFHVWWDEGISPGVGWHEEVAASIGNCSLFMFLCTENTADSTYCRNELDFAEKEEIDFLAVHLSPMEVPPGLALSLGRKQAIHKVELSEHQYQKKMLDAIGESVQYKIRRLDNKTIVFTDIRNFNAIVSSLSTHNLENFLIFHETLCREIAFEFEGSIWLVEGDACCFSFDEFDPAVYAMLSLSKQFQQYADDNKIDTALAIGINEGEMNVFRSFIFGEDINEAGSCAYVARYYRQQEVKSNFILKAREGLERFGKISEVKTSDFSEGIQDRFSKFLSENNLVRFGIEDEIL